jgi:serine phosphatase RsbU (regulator of sigma subunit)
MSTDKRTLAIVIGASEFPYCPTLGGGDAFSNSAEDVHGYLHQPKGLNLPPADVLNLFDDRRPAGELLEEIDTFLIKRQGRKTSTKAEGLLVYYVGHGGFTRDGQEYFLTVRSTRTGLEGPSSIRINDLGHVIKNNARFFCQYLILDCCFSAQAYKTFQSGPGQAAVARTLDSIPTKGTALLCSSGPKEAFLAPEGCAHTMFSEALLNVLKTGDPKFSEFLSLYDVRDLIDRQLRDTYQDERVTPEVHCPNQPEGDLSRLPLFPNPAYTVPSAEWRRVIVVDDSGQQLPEEIISALRSSLPSVRITALRELVELCKTTPSAKTTELARSEILRCSEKDDSTQVRNNAKDALAHIPTIADGAAALIESADQVQLEDAAKRYRQELAIAAEIQQRLMTVTVPDVPYAKVNAVSYACKDIGGDFFDLVYTTGGLSLVVADVSGKGVSSAVVASILLGMLYSQLARDPALPEMIAAVNRFLCEKVGGQKYATLVIARLLESGELELLNCGHVPPLLVSGDTITKLEDGNLPVGLVPGVEFQARLLQLNPGDRLLLVTDGVTEAEDANGEFFGNERLENCCRDGLAAIEQAVTDFRGETPLTDDCTITEMIYLGSDGSVLGSLSST